MFFKQKKKSLNLSCVLKLIKKNLNYILLIKKKEMKKITLLITIILAFTACKNTNTESANPSEADKATFARNIKAFENHHVKGFATED